MNETWQSIVINTTSTGPHGGEWWEYLLLVVIITGIVYLMQKYQVYQKHRMLKGMRRYGGGVGRK